MAGTVANINIETGELIVAELPQGLLDLVSRWAAEHRDELRANWERARKPEPLLPVAPLEYIHVEGRY